MSGATYAMQRVLESCAAQGIPVVPTADLLEVVAAMLAERATAAPPEKVKSRPTKGGTPSDLLTGEISAKSTAPDAPALRLQVTS